MLNTIHYYLYYKCESRHYSAVKKTSFVSSIGFYYQKKKFKVFFWCDLGGHWIVGYPNSKHDGRRHRIVQL